MRLYPPKGQGRDTLSRRLGSVQRLAPVRAGGWEDCFSLIIMGHGCSI